MASICSPTTLQQACEVAAAAWLVQWSGWVGQVTARASAPQRQNNVRRDATRARNRQGVGRGRDRGSGDTPFRGKCQAATPSPGFHRVPKGTPGRSKFARTAAVVQYEELRPPSGDDSHTAALSLSQNDAQHGAGGIFAPDGPPHLATHTASKTTTSPELNKDICNAIVKKNVAKCSSFFKTQLPPALINQIVSTAWRLVSQHVALGGRFEAVPEYQVSDWLRQAPVLLRVAGELTHRSFLLDLSGVPEACLDVTLAEINDKLPQDHVSKVVLPKAKFKSCKLVVPKCQSTLFEFVKKSYNLVSLTLHSELCDNKALGLFSRLPLQELDIGSRSVTEEGILTKFCGLPFQSGNKAVEAIRDCKYSYSLTQLSKCLRRFSMSFDNISSSVHHLILILFPELQFYNPHRDIKPSISNFARFSVPLENEHSCTPRKLKLVKIILGRASRSEILEVSRACPSAREISLDVELNSEESLDALQSFEELSDLTLAYYPSFASSPPKLNGSVLLPLLTKCKNRVQSLNLTGFNISDTCLHELSQLPELKSLSMADCWLANPKRISHDPFSSLESLTLKFLPPNSAMQLLTSGGTLHSLNFDFIASEWEGSALSDTHVKQLVTSGRIATLQSFMASSPYLTLGSVKSLTLLPSLRNIGHVARWGLTEEELHCISHSGPPHLICMQ